MQKHGNKWDRRIERARELACLHPFSAQILNFYSKLTAFQKATYVQLQTSYGPRNGRSQSLPAALDEVGLGLLLRRWGPFLGMIASEAPAPLARFARNLNAQDAAAGSALLPEFWPGDRPESDGSAGEPGTPHMGAHAAREQEPVSSGVTATAHAQDSPGPPEGHFRGFCAHALLQPYAEFLADRADAPEPPARRPTCPFCASPPLVGVLRQEGDGAKRSLVCSFCRTEWDYPRIACPACEERDEKRLYVYSTPAFDCVRVEACDTCRAYIKTIDLTKSGLAVPEVDDLAAIPLSLWAEESGYSKVIRNIVGL